jgi:hypothetical protein
MAASSIESDADCTESRLIGGHGIYSFDKTVWTTTMGRQQLVCISQLLGVVGVYPESVCRKPE